MRKVLFAVAMTWSLGLLGTAHAQAPAPETQPPAAVAPAPAAPAAPPAMLTDADIKGLSGPKAEDKAKGDPGGDAKKGLTIGDVVGQVGQNVIAINFVWTLVTGFLVMFMQAGFALVETGLTRAKNVAHTMGMNFLVYPIGILGFWAVGFGLQMGGVGALTTFGGDTPPSRELVVALG